MGFICTMRSLIDCGQHLWNFVSQVLLLCAHRFACFPNASPEARPPLTEFQSERPCTFTVSISPFPKYAHPFRHCELYLLFLPLSSCHHLLSLADIIPRSVTRIKSAFKRHNHTVLYFRRDHFGIDHEFASRRLTIEISTRL